MRRKVKEVIPKDVLEAAEAVGLKSPLWYIGRRACSGADVRPIRTVEEIVMEARKEAGIEGDLPWPKIGPPLPDPFEG
jgi:hypothetical protein